MIGDWVQVPSELNRYKRIRSTFDMDSAVLYKPIPLTPEILEKNGWEKTPTGYVFYTDGKKYDNSLWYIFGSNTFVVNTAEFQIKYVHELQHALRLCGIEKEIEL